jgi:hypothetical protein
MIDVLTNKPMRVIAAKDDASYFDLAVSQVEAVRKVLDEHGIQYWVSESRFSLNNGPWKTTIQISARSGPVVAQAALDSVP